MGLQQLEFARTTVRCILMYSDEWQNMSSLFFYLCTHHDLHLCLPALTHTHLCTFITTLFLYQPCSQHSQAKESSQAPQMEVVGGEEGGDGEMAVRYERDLVHKLKLLRHELSLQQPQAGHCRIEVSREEIFEVGTGRETRA